MKKIVLSALIILMIVACRSSYKTSNDQKQSTTYKRDENAIHPQFAVFHVSDTISELHFRISSKELLYTRPDGINFSANVVISYRLLPTYDSKFVIDSSSVRLTDINNNDADKYLIGELNVKAQAGHNYFLRVTVNDMNRNISVTNVISIEKNNDLNRQNFIVRTTSNDAPLFHNYIKPGEEVSINYKSKIAVSLFVRYYKRNFFLSAPPFSLSTPPAFQYKADSIFVLQLSPEGRVNFKTSKIGFYHFQLDSSKREGLTLFNYGENFPEVKKAEDMVPPLRFITSQQEFEELMTSNNKKASIEKFWMNCSGNQDRAKELIRKYYTRVQDANNYFTSFLEGWKTDRGMIYLIYGAPNVIYRTATAETWTYGEENNISSLSYTFTKVNNPFTDNDFILERSGSYKQSWYVAVDIWRQGRVYLQD